jgi:hypothetical protein
VKRDNLVRLIPVYQIGLESALYFRAALMPGEFSGISVVLSPYLEGELIPVCSREVPVQVDSICVLSRLCKESVRVHYGGNNHLYLIQKMRVVKQYLPDKMKTLIHRNSLISMDTAEHKIDRPIVIRISQSILLV